MNKDIKGILKIVLFGVAAVYLLCVLDHGINDYRQWVRHSAIDDYDGCRTPYTVGQKSEEECMTQAALDTSYSPYPWWLAFIFVDSNKWYERDAQFGDNIPFTQEALETYTAEKPTRYSSKKECEEITGDVCNVTVISTISATSSEAVYWFSPIYPQKTAEKNKKIEWQEYINISTQARLNYCKKVNGYTYIHSDVCLIDNELKYLNYDFIHSTTTSKGTTVWNSAPSDIMEWEEEDILKYLIEHIKTTDVHWPNDEQKARESYREYIKLPKKAHNMSTTTMESVKPLEYPLESEHWKIKSTVIKTDGEITKDALSLDYCTKYTHRVGCFWSGLVSIDNLNTADLKELYQLLKSKYE